MEKQIKYHTPQQALIKIRDWCAYQERCQQEARDKLYDYGLKTDDVENMIAQLVSENFINEERFAIAFAGGKFRIKKWGKVKIKQELKAKRVSDYCIKKGLAVIDNTEYINTLKKVLALKAKSITEKNFLKKKQKLVRYALSKGYEQDIIFDLLKSQEED
ncbi:MAG TPA: regulatory protein RecX [Bacteroidia bacterium]|nr:regulatory protein RecX [Bacteroidia bacterium]